jgi:hypothetical protein
VKKPGLSAPFWKVTICPTFSSEDWLAPRITIKSPTFKVGDIESLRTVKDRPPVTNGTTATATARKKTPARKTPTSAVA